MSKSDKINVVASSFRDPAGFLFTNSEGTLLRQINSVGILNYNTATQVGLYDKLFKKGYLVRHKELSATKTKVIIQPSYINTISYPFEWSFTMLKDAALLTLKIQKIALKHQLSLKDASAYNIQFIGAQPILIDTLSFESYPKDKPWVAYGQFCRHFLAPLLLMSYNDVRSSQMLRTYIDGIPLDLANSILPNKAKLKFSVLMHISLHSKIQAKHADDRKVSNKKLPMQNLLGVIDSLERLIKKLEPKNSNTEWMDYYNNTNYSESAAKNKEKLIASFAKAIPKLKSVLDLGGNDGHYSSAFAANKIQTICADIDPFAVEYNYLRNKNQKNTNMTPLLIDLTNPGGAIGWANTERTDVTKRLRSDLTMALALIHHLAISNNLPFGYIAEYFSKFGPYLIIEFVPKEDSQVKKLLATREDIFNTYTESNFEKEFLNIYKIIKKESIKGTYRTLYLLKVKK